MSAQPAGREIPEITVRERIRHLLKGSDLTDPRDVATLLVSQMTERQKAAALIEVLPEYVRQEMKQARQPVRIPSPSRKVASIRDMWARHLETRWAVGATNEWKQFGDLTAADLAACADFRRDVAARNAATAERFDRIQVALVEAGAETVRDLPRNVAIQAWGTER